MTLDQLKKGMKRAAAIANDEYVLPDDPINELIVDNQLLVEEANELLEENGIPKDEDFGDLAPPKIGDDSDEESKMGESELDALFEEFGKPMENKLQKKKKPATRKTTKWTIDGRKKPAAPQRNTGPKFKVPEKSTGEPYVKETKEREKKSAKKVKPAVGAVTAGQPVK